MVQSGVSSNKRSQFRLRGPQQSSDSRITPIRGDLADIRLAGQFFAPHYAQSKIAHCIAPSAIMTNAAHDMAVSEIIYGEKFAVLDISGEHAWGYSVHDDYVGYVAWDALAMSHINPTHQVSSRSALIFAEPSIKSTVINHLPMGSKVEAQPSEHEKFMQAAGGYIHTRHLSPIGKTQHDSAALAALCMGAPYLWGGRSGDAMDCSGLVQMVLGLQGIAVPRDSDMQHVIGRAIADNAPLSRNDIIFFPGHVGIMSDSENIIHANAHWMQVKREPLADVVARIDGDDRIIARRRLK